MILISMSVSQRSTPKVTASADRRLSKSKIRSTSLILFSVFSMITSSIFAKDNPDDIEVVVVSATRTEKPISELSNTVSVIDAKQIEREIANGIDDLIRYEPGVSVAGGGRFGLSSFSIRGVGGDRVLTLVDSTPTADEFSFGPFLSSRRDFVDIDALKSVEIVRGPGSSVYGSNAIGGVVNFITKEPIDYLGDNAVSGSAKLGYSSVDSSTNTTLLTAFGSETWSGMLVGTLRDGAETDTFFTDEASGAQRRAQNPQEFENSNIYAKLVYSPSDTHRINVVAERFVSDSMTDILSTAGTFSRGVLINSEVGRDDRTRERVSVEYRLVANTPLFDSLNILAYTQNSDAQQNTSSERWSGSATQNRMRNSSYEQENSGTRVQLVKTYEVSRTTHELIYGVDYDQSDTATIRTGRTIDQASGALLPEVSNFPTRDFPNSEFTSIGGFIQDDISLFDGRLHVIPALRYDRFKLEPRVDAIYLSGNTGSPTPEGYDESQVSAKIGFVYEISGTWSVFSQYAEGFRAPPLDAVNTGFTNFAGGYTTLPNPDLEPERGESIEIGLRRLSDAGSIEFAAYQNTYEDFIESLSVRGFNPATGLLEFQARNLDQAEITGLEFKARYQLGALSERLTGVNLRAAFAYADGQDKQTGSPINSIDPQQLVVGLGYAPSDDKWSIEAVVTASGRKESDDIDGSSLQARGEPAITPFETPGFATLDLIGHYNLTDRARINWGIFNIADKQHYLWSEEFVQNPATTNFDRLTEPGRNYSVAVKYNF